MTPGEAARALWWGDGTRRTMTREQDAAKWDAIAAAAIEASEEVKRLKKELRTARRVIAHYVANTEMP